MSGDAMAGGKEPKHITVHCDCRAGSDPKRKQKTVFLFKGIDPKFWVGDCNCGKKHVRKVE